MMTLFLLLVLFGCMKDKGEVLSTPTLKPIIPEISLDEANIEFDKNLKILNSRNIYFTANKDIIRESAFHYFIYSKSLLIAFKFGPHEFETLIDSLNTITVTSRFPKDLSGIDGVHINGKIYLNIKLNNPIHIVTILYHELCHAYYNKSNLKYEFRKIHQYDNYPSFLSVEMRRISEKFAYTCADFLLGKADKKNDRIINFFNNIFLNHDHNSLIDEMEKFQREYKNLLRLIKRN